MAVTGYFWGWGRGRASLQGRYGIVRKAFFLQFTYRIVLKGAHILAVTTLSLRFFYGYYGRISLDLYSFGYKKRLMFIEGGVAAPMVLECSQDNGFALRVLE